MSFLTASAVSILLAGGSAPATAPQGSPTTAPGRHAARRPCMPGADTAMSSGLGMTTYEIMMPKPSTLAAVRRGRCRAPGAPTAAADPASGAATSAFSAGTRARR